jgi:hypothetical protein
VQPGRVRAPGEDKEEGCPEGRGTQEKRAFHAGVGTGYGFRYSTDRSSHGQGSRGTHCLSNLGESSGDGPSLGVERSARHRGACESRARRFLTLPSRTG